MRTFSIMAAMANIAEAQSAVQYEQFRRAASSAAGPLFPVCLTICLSIQSEPPSDASFQRDRITPQARGTAVVKAQPLMRANIFSTHGCRVEVYAGQDVHSPRNRVLPKILGEV
jgi:hypothetical protein